MGYSRDIYAAAQAELERRRTDAVTRAAALRESMIARYPRLADIEREMARSSSQVVRAVLDGGDVDAAVEAIKTRNLALQAEMAAILANAGAHAPNFEPVPLCPLCGDTGFHGGQRCECYEALLREEACRRLSGMSGMKLTSFDEMDLDYYPDVPDPATGMSVRERMSSVLAYCRQYAERFSTTSPSLLLRGPTGTGKTHAALAIARRAAEKGFGVVYGPVQVLLRKLEKEHFGREEGRSEEMMTACDLLVLDDLGTEFASPFTVSCLYNLINTRMLSALPVIISTNLNQSQMQDRYGDPITSRITGAFEPVIFVGRDIRQVKTERRLQGLL